MKPLPLLLSLLAACTMYAQQPGRLPEVGIVEQMQHDSLLNAIGFDYLTESTRRILSPREVTETEFEALLPAIAELRVPMYACNLFIPGDLKVVGPAVDEEAVLAYVEVVLSRAGRAGVRLITWGSGGSRAVPEGFSRVAATAQFIHMARRVAEVAAKHGVLLALENLNSGECNFITSLAEALAVVKAVDHPNFRLCVDIYHMLRENEPANAIAGVGPYAVYCEVAEREDRTPPGVRGDDLVPYFTALRQEGYRGKIMIEARWEDLSRQGPVALATLREQLAEAYR